MMEDRTRLAIGKWLGWAPASQEVQRLRSDPLGAYFDLLDVLPPHLLSSAFAAPVTTPMQRGEDARVRKRRRVWADAKKPEELQLEQARQRDPTVSLQSMGCQDPRLVAPIRLGVEDEAGDNNTVTHPKDVMSKPRFASMMKRLDEEEDAHAKARTDWVKRAEEDVEEEEEEEDSDDDGSTSRDHSDDRAADRSEIHDMQDTILVRYIRGNDDLPPHMYACDFDDKWDETEIAATGPQQQIGRNLAISSEDAWFDDEEAS